MTSLSKPIVRIEDQFTMAAGDLAESTTIKVNARLKLVSLAVPSLGGDTVTFQIYDEQGAKVWEQAAIPEDAITPYTIAEVVIAGESTLRMILSGVQGTSVTITTLLYGE